MRIPLSVLLVAALTLGGCAVVRDSAVNPFNWFGRSTSVPVAAGEPAEATNPLIPQRTGILSRRDTEVDAYVGLPFGEVVDMTIEKIPEGAIIRVTGRAARQGIYAVQLTPEDEDLTPIDGVLSFRLEGIEPARNLPQGAPQTREVVVARKVTNQQLRGVDTIRVEGLSNARVARR
ncbi:hypothetical protein [uncultured Sulfitobacter sp.]|uniref:hypothetical protein n=1 Tax=uncultured Sulfitobacter sp. TaxID=191468 RepID=UPI0026246B56|nr:hypothetical protein [uncultured Sulfitobacter sp.]